MLSFIKFTSLCIFKILFCIIIHLLFRLCKSFFHFFAALFLLLGDSVKYKWPENGNHPIIPDVSINCDIKNRRSTTFLGVPKFIMEVLSDSTEKRDREEKMELYKAVEVAEYWLVDWRKKQVEIYLLVTDESSIDTIDYKLVNVITNDNKEDLKIHVFPNVNITFEELFDGIE